MRAFVRAKMAKLLLFSLLAATALAADLDYTKFQPRDLHRPSNPYYQQSSEGRITNGRPATLGQFPHQVALFLTVPEGLSFCGGSIISKDWILTAAHCAEGALSVEVRAGLISLDQPAEQTIIVNGTDTIIHENWDSSNIRNDIALIRLPQPLTFGDNVQPILLPRQSDASKSFTGAQVVASGWGKTSDAATSVSRSLQYVDSTVPSMLICKLAYLLLAVQETNICMNTTGGKSVCNGDSGGPLVTTEASGNTIHIGVTSFVSGLGCESGIPGVFTRTTSYLSWISSKTQIPLR